jgi:hypothetical protein
LHVKIIDIDDLVGYVYIARVDALNDKKWKPYVPTKTNHLLIWSSNLPSTPMTYFHLPDPNVYIPYNTTAPVEVHLGAKGLKGNAELLELSTISMAPPPKLGGSPFKENLQHWRWKM